MGILKDAKGFYKQFALARWTARTADTTAERRVAGLQVLSYKALQFLMTRLAVLLLAVLLAGSACSDNAMSPATPAGEPIAAEPSADAEDPTRTESAILAKHAPDIPIVFIDTGYHFPETYRYLETLQEFLLGVPVATVRCVFFFAAIHRHHDVRGFGRSLSSLNRKYWDVDAGITLGF